MLAVIVGIVLARSSVGGYKTGATLPALGSTTPTGPVGPRPPPVGSATPRVAPPPAAAPEDAAIDPDEDGDDDGDRIAGAIERATRKALRRGEPVHWHKAGQEGFVTVSEATDRGDHICRSVVATVTGDDGAAQSSTHIWCRGIDDDDDEWTPG